MRGSLYGRLLCMEKRRDVAEIIRNSSPEKLEKVSELLDRSKMTLREWGNAPERISDEDAELIVAMDDAWTGGEA